MRDSWHLYFKPQKHQKHQKHLGLVPFFCHGSCFPCVASWHCYQEEAKRARMEIKRERQAEKCEVRSRAGELFMNPLEHFHEFPQLFMNMTWSSVLLDLSKLSPYVLSLLFLRRRRTKKSWRKSLAAWRDLQISVVQTAIDLQTLEATTSASQEQLKCNRLQRAFSNVWVVQQHFLVKHFNTRIEDISTTVSFNFLKYTYPYYVHIPFIWWNEVKIYLFLNS